MSKTVTPALTKVSHKKGTVKGSKKSKSKTSSALATCPTNGAGWCPYPFSVEQLERRMKAKAEAAVEAAKTKLPDSNAKNLNAKSLDAAKKMT